MAGLVLLWKGSGAGPSGIAGEVAQTLGAVTLSSTGALRVTGALSQTLGPLTSSSAGAVSIAGAAGGQLGAVTLSATGRLQVTAAMSAALGPVTLVAAGALAIRGAVVGELGAIVSASSGGFSLAGDLGGQLGPVALLASGTLTISGAVVATLGPLTSTSAAVIGDGAGGESPIAGGIGGRAHKWRATEPEGPDEEERPANALTFKRKKVLRRVATDVQPQATREEIWDAARAAIATVGDTPTIADVDYLAAYVKGELDRIAARSRQRRARDDEEAALGLMVLL